MSTVAENFLKKFPASSKNYNISKTGEECLLDIKDFVTESANKFVGKDYSHEHLIGALLKDHKKLTEQELSGYLKCNLVAAKYYFIALCEEIENAEGDQTYHSIKKYSRKIRSFLHDYRPVIEYFKRRQDKDYTFFQGGKNYTHHTFELYITYKRLFWANDTELNIYEKTKPNLACFTLRQSIELKVMRILGLYSFYNKTYDGPKVGNEFFIEFLKKYSEQIIFENLNPTTLQQVYKWTNLTIHTGNIPRSWQLYLAINYADRLLKPVSDEKSFSAAGRIKIKKFKKLQAELLNKLFEENDNEVVCVNIKESESEIISYN